MIAGALQTYASGVQASMVVTGGLSYPIQVQVDPTKLSGSAIAPEPPHLFAAPRDHGPTRAAGKLQAEPGAGERQQVQPCLHGKPHHHHEAGRSPHPRREEQDRPGPADVRAAGRRVECHDQQPLQSRHPCRPADHDRPAHVPSGAFPRVPRDGRPVQLLAISHLPAPARAACPGRRPPPGVRAGRRVGHLRNDGHAHAHRLIREERHPVPGLRRGAHREDALPGRPDRSGAASLPAHHHDHHDGARDQLPAHPGQGGRIRVRQEHGSGHAGRNRVLRRPDFLRRAGSLLPVREKTGACSRPGRVCTIGEHAAGKKPRGSRSVHALRSERKHHLPRPPVGQEGWRHPHRYRGAGVGRGNRRAP